MHLFVRTGACFFMASREYRESRISRVSRESRALLKHEKGECIATSSFSKLECQLSFKFERIFNADDFILELAVDLHALLHLLATMENSGMVATGDEFANP